LAEQLAAADCIVHLVVSPHGQRLLAEELGVAAPAELMRSHRERLAVHPYDDIGDALASGSVRTDGMVICPASVNTVASIAAGLAGNLIDRAAHVHLKERRPLVIVPRETPLTQIDLANLLRLSQAGATIAPACPGFYLQPKTVDDLAAFVVGRVLDCLGIDHGLAVRYRELEQGDQYA
jgi:4-hydroxy-3-polyprenylbenzoate decarboxylase